MANSETTNDLLHKLEGELKRKRVLIVDRHTSARDSMRLMLSTIGITSVNNAGTAAEVLRQVKANSFDIILSDYLLDDGRDGQQLLEELRLQRLIPLATVFIIITSERSYHNVVSVAELTPDDYLIKPFTADQLQGRLLKAIYRKHHFATVLRRIDEAAYAQALTGIDRLLANKTPFELDALRLKGETLNVLGRFDEAEILYRRVLLRRPLPWARMGLATALRGRKSLEEAASLAQAVVSEHPDYLSAYDFLAAVREEMGHLDAAQEVLQQAAGISPNNSTRQRIVGDIAVRNQDFETAEKAYGKVLERHRASSLRQVDDYTNLSRVLLDKGDPVAARQVAKELRRDWRGSKLGEFAASIVDSLCHTLEEAPDKAKAATQAALALHAELHDGEGAPAAPHRIAVDLANACLATGEVEFAEKLLRQMAAENNENPALIEHILSVYTKHGREDAGRELIAAISKEIVEINNRGVLAARGGKIEDSVDLLIEAAERVPSVQFLINASKAILTLMDKKGWQEEYGERALTYLDRARGKNPRDPRVLSAFDLYHRVARKYGITQTSVPR